MKFISHKSDDKKIDRYIILLTMVNRPDIWLPWFLDWAPSPETWVQPSANMACVGKKKTDESKTVQYAPLDCTRQQLESIGVTGILVV